ncbi:MAG: hypothetical protein JXB14_05720 [Candidatus Altiarchaeota archaeon]|nr:hypothetical protein [Candidatus Altiarchaeota archaeon]
MEQTDRVPTGIPGLDEVLEGGIPRGASVLVTGTPGTAKTIFSLHFIANGAMKYKEKGIFITMEQDLKDVQEQFLQFGVDLQKLQDDGLIWIISPEIRIEEGEDFLHEITRDAFLSKLAKFEPQRFVIDSFNVILQFSTSYGGDRRGIERIFHTLKRKLNVTTIYTDERDMSGMNVKYGMQDFVADGIIYLQLIQKQNVFNRGLTVLKMRKTDHGKGIYPFKIEKDGIHLYPDQQIF